MLNYYFSRLTNEQKLTYKSILSCIFSFSKEIEVSVASTSELNLMLDYILLDNPLIFYVSGFMVASEPKNKKCYIKPIYEYSEGFVKENTVVIKNHLKVFDSVKLKSDLEKELFVHDFCLRNFKYDGSFNKISHSALGLILNKTAVCEGIAKYVKLVFDYIGVKSLVVTGEGKDPKENSKYEPHAWNIVKIDNKTYHLDVTYNMSLSDKINRYDYFNLSDEDIKNEYKITSITPKCVTTGNDYYSINSLLANNPTELASIINKRLKQGEKNIVLKLKNVKDTRNVAKKVLSIAQEQYYNIYNQDTEVFVSPNLFQCIFEIGFI